MSTGSDVVVEDGEITEVRKSKPSDPAISADTVIDVSDRLVAPWLVSAHAHLEISATPARSRN